MKVEIVANLFVVFLCLVYPVLAFAFGQMVGRHGFRRALTLVLVKIFGQAPSDVERGE